MTGKALAKYPHELVPWETSVTAIIAVCQAAPKSLQPVNEVDHFYLPGLYIRVWTCRAGTLAVGAKHKTRTTCFMTHGKMVFWPGPRPVTICAPCTLVAEAKSQKVGFAVTDCVFMSIHDNPKDLRDPTVIMDLL